MSLDEKYGTIGETQENLNQLKREFKEEGFGAIESNFEDLEIALQTSKLKLIEDFEPKIRSVLEEEIIKRYFYREGMYAYFLATNKEVFKAQEIINDRDAYNNLLK
jgi:carboxyl-terminal processing protease